MDRATKVLVGMSEATLPAPATVSDIGKLSDMISTATELASKKGKIAKALKADKSNTGWSTDLEKIFKLLGNVESLIADMHMEISQSSGS